MDDYSRYVLAATKETKTRENIGDVVKSNALTVKKQDLNLLRRKLTELETKIEKFNNKIDEVEILSMKKQFFRLKPLQKEKLLSQYFQNQKYLYALSYSFLHYFQLIKIHILLFVCY